MEEEVIAKYDATRFTLADNETWHNERLIAKVLMKNAITPKVETHYLLKAFFCLA